jgi:uncharacterized protein YecT (DUF1311 family)
MKALNILVATSFLLGASSSYAADAPNLDKCLEDAGGVTVAMNNCYGESLSFWDALLNSNYKLAMKGCSESEDPAACKKALKTSERNWIKYKDSTVELIGIRIDGEFSGVVANAFLVKATQRQAEDLAVYKPY